MAFHDAWEEDPEPRDLRPLFKWIAIVGAGLVLGATCYLGLVPSGLLRELASDAPQPTEMATEQAENDQGMVPATECPAATPEPSSIVTNFVNEINAGRYASAWSGLDVTFQLSRYQLDPGAFQREWASGGRIELGQMTFSSPSETEAILLATLDFAERQTDSEKYTFRLVYSSEACRWLIADIATRD